MVVKLLNRSLEQLHSQAVIRGSMRPEVVIWKDKIFQYNNYIELHNDVKVFHYVECEGIILQ